MCLVTFRKPSFSQSVLNESIHLQSAQHFLKIAGTSIIFEWQVMAVSYIMAAAGRSWRSTSY